MLLLMLNQQCQSTEDNMMLICWFVNTGFKRQGVDITQQIFIHCWLVSYCSKLFMSDIITPHRSTT